MSLSSSGGKKEEKEKEKRMAALSKSAKGKERISDLDRTRLSFKTNILLEKEHVGGKLSQEDESFAMLLANPMSAPSTPKGHH